MINHFYYNLEISEYWDMKVFHSHPYRICYSVGPVSFTFRLLWYQYLIIIETCMNIVCKQVRLNIILFFSFFNFIYISMRFNRSKFLATVFFQLIFLLLDIAFNVISDKLIVRKENYTLLLLYVWEIICNNSTILTNDTFCKIVCLFLYRLQDACILMSLTLISLSLFRTNVFRVSDRSVDTWNCKHLNLKFSNTTLI